MAETAVLFRRTDLDQPHRNLERRFGPSDGPWSAIHPQRRGAAIRDRLGGRLLAQVDGGRAHEAGLSRFHLLRLFRAAYGASPIAYAEAVRMQRVRCLLTDGAGQVGEVAAALGYDSPSAFARPFRRRTGRAPGDVRRI